MTETSESTTVVTLAQLRREFAKHGWTRKPTARIVMELAVHLLTIVAGAAMYFAHWPLPLRVIGIAVSAFGCVAVASNSHTSSHYATSSKRWVNEALTFFGYAFVLGLSALFWWKDHGEHHAAPNVIGLDDDFDYRPFFNIDAAAMPAPGLRSWYYRKIQRYLIGFAALMLGFNLQRRGTTWLAMQWRKPSRGVVLDSALVIAHFGLLVAVPCYFLGTGTFLTFYCLRMLLVSGGLFSILAPAHFPTEAVLLNQSTAAGLSHGELQTLTTINYSGGRLLQWITSGLGYQIEHHLFPEIGHPRYKEISPLVEEFCQATALPHRTYPFPKALAESFRVFAVPKDAWEREGK